MSRIFYFRRHPKRQFSFLKTFLLALALCSVAGNLFCQWDGNPITVDNRVLPFGGYQISVSDDAGGAIVVASSYSYLFAQRKSVTGKLLWDSLAAPVLLRNGTSIILSDVQKDGHGGAYIVFGDVVSNMQSDLYLQRLDSNGNKLFGETGVKVNPAGSPLNYHAKLSVGKNGATVVWGNTWASVWDLNDSLINNAQLYIQRFGTAGTPLWTQALQVSTAPTGRISPVVASDDNDGTYAIFTDFRNLQKLPESSGNYYTNEDIYMQYFNALGQRMWGNTDSALSASPADERTYEDSYSEKTSVSDGNGGFEIIYLNNGSLYAQKVNKSGQKSWTRDLHVGNFVTKYGIQAISDGEGGLVADWFKVGPMDPFIFSQRVTAGGTLPWGATPLTVNSPGDGQIYNPSAPAMTLDNEGNYLFAWQNSYNVSGSQLKAQKITPTGDKVWKTEGVIIYQGASFQSYISTPLLLVSTGNKIMAIWRRATEINPAGDITSALLESQGALFDDIRISETVKDGNWNDPTIWANGKVPAPDAAVTIKTNITVNQQVTCRSLKVLLPGILTVRTGFTITITD